MNDNVVAKDFVVAGLNAGNATEDFFNPLGRYKITCRGIDGEIKWEDEFPNVVTDVGKQGLLNIYFRGTVAIGSTWYLGLKNTGTPAATDTMLSHGTWTENATYSNSTRPTWTSAAASGTGTVTITNSASAAVFNINGTTTIFGCFLTSDSTKSGTSGTLFSAADFAASRSVLSGDTLTVTYSISC